MNDYINGLSHHLTDLEIADIETLFGSDPAIAILVDGTAKDRRRADRRKKTIVKHNHQKAIVESVYPIKDSYVKKNPKKAIRDAKEYYIWDYYSDEPIRKKVAKKFELRQAKIEISYEERRSQFFKAVDRWQHDEEEVFVHVSTPSYKIHVKLNDCREYDFDTLDEALDFVEHCAYGYSISRRNYDYPLYDVNEDGDCLTYQGKEYYIDGCWYGFYLDNLGAHYFL